MWEKLKKHPWVIAAIVGVFLLVLLLSSSSSSSGTSTADQTASTDNGDQIASYMAALNLQGQQVQAAAQVTNNQTAAAVTVAQLQANSTDTANTLAAQVAEFETQIAGTTQQNADTLSAQVAENQNNDTLAAIESNNAASIQNTATLANVINYQTTQQANEAAGQQQTNQDYINNLTSIITAQNGPATAAASRQCTSVLFGLFSSC